MSLERFADLPGHRRRGDLPGQVRAESIRGLLRSGRPQFGGLDTASQLLAGPVHAGRHRLLLLHMPVSLRPIVLAVLLVFPGLGCKSSSLNPGGPAAVAAEQSCDPLAAKPIALGGVVGVGQNADGTLYVDAASGVFVSANGSLIRQHVVGTGQSGSTYFTFSFTDPGADIASARDLIVQIDGAGNATMTLGPDGSGKTRSDAGVSSLMVVAASTVAGMPVVNTPDVISYVGNAANGDVLVATVPMNDESGPSDGGIYDGGLSIFYGPPTAVAQRTIAGFEESLSGTGTVTFLVDATPYDLQFGDVPAPDAGPLGTFALLGLGAHGGPSMAITLVSPTPTALPAGLAFTCLP